MTQYFILPAHEDHAIAMAPHMRPADVAEVYAASGRDPETALISSINRSTQAWTCFVDGEPACIWGVGVVSLLNLRGSPWLLGTCHVERHPKEFLRQSRTFLREMLVTYSHLENHVDSRNALAVRWLSWLGFIVEAPRPYGFLDLPFHRFSMRRSAM